MRKIISASFTFLLFIAPAAFTQDLATIKGTVLDSLSGKYLAGANVYIQDTIFGSSTDKLGGYAIKNVPAGTHTITCSFVGYSLVTKIVTVKGGDTVMLDFSLTPQALGVKEIVVSREFLLGGTGKITGIPGSAHFISQKELDKYKYTDINRVLRRIPGINIQEEDGYGQRPDIGMRGTGVERSQKISLMEDGILIAPAPYSAPAAYYFPTIGRMEGIEIRKGSSQIKYGPYTTGGALNLISTKIPFTFGGRVDVTAGENDARTIHAYAGDSYKNMGFLVESYMITVDGFKKLDTGGNTGFDKKDFMVKVRFNTSQDAQYYQSLMLKSGQTDDVSQETYLGLTDADFERNPFRRYAASQVDEMKANHKHYSARYFIKFSNSFDMTSTAYRNEFTRNWYKLDKVIATAEGSSKKISDILDDPIGNAAEYSIITGVSSPNENALEVKANNRNYVSTGIQSIFGAEFGNREEALHQVEFGIRYHTDKIDRFQWVDKYRMENLIMKLTSAGTPGTESNRITSAKAWSSFFQYRYKRDRIIVIPGIRYEDISLTRDDYGKSDPGRTGNHVSSSKNDMSVLIAGLGVDFAFTPHLNTFGGIHKGFSPPGPKIGAKPETSINYEAGFRYRSASVNNEVILFFNDYENLLGADLAAAGGSGSSDLFNGGAVDIKGIEYSLNYDPVLAFNSKKYAIPIALTYTYTVSEFKNNFTSDYEPWNDVGSGDELPYLPRHQYSLSVGFVAQSVSLYTSGSYVGKMRTRAGKGSFIDHFSTNSQFIIDASVEYSINQKNAFYISAQNLAGKVYIVARRPAGVRPGLPRTIMVGLKTDF